MSHLVELLSLSSRTSKMQEKMKGFLKISADLETELQRIVEKERARQADLEDQATRNGNDARAKVAKLSKECEDLETESLESMVTIEEESDKIINSIESIETQCRALRAACAHFQQRMPEKKDKGGQSYECEVEKSQELKDLENQAEVQRECMEHLRAQVDSLRKATMGQMLTIRDQVQTLLNDSMARHNTIVQSQNVAQRSFRQSINEIAVPLAANRKLVELLDADLDVICSRCMSYSLLLSLSS